MFREVLGAEHIANINRHFGDGLQISDDFQREVVLYEFLKQVGEG